MAFIFYEIDIQTGKKDTRTFYIDQTTYHYIGKKLEKIGFSPENHDVEKRVKDSGIDINAYLCQDDKLENDLLAAASSRTTPSQIEKAQDYHKRIKAFLSYAIPYMIKRGDILTTPTLPELKQIIKMFSRSISEFEDVMPLYPTFGALPKALPCIEDITSLRKDEVDEVKAQLKEAFLKGAYKTSPKILDELALTYLYRKMMSETPEDLPPVEDYATKFHLESVSRLVKVNVPIAHIAMLYTSVLPKEFQKIVKNPQLAEYVSLALYKAEQDADPNYKNVAAYILKHPNTDLETIDQIYDYAKFIPIDPRDTKESLQVKIWNAQAPSAIEAIEKSYSKVGFKFANCECNLKNVGEVITKGKYKAYILEPQDPKAAILAMYVDFDNENYYGDVWDSCQHLGDAGESAMMHGFLNPKAGFWVIADAKTDAIKAYAEIWEKDDNTIVFDNIEFKNDSEISLYKDILKAWVKCTDYPNVIMGSGYNGFAEAHLRIAGQITPKVTAYELYVMSHEPGNQAKKLKSIEDADALLAKGDHNFFEYLYCDSCFDLDHGYLVRKCGLWLKENDRLEPFFMNEISRSDYATGLHNAAKAGFTKELFNDILYKNGFALMPPMFNTNLEEMFHPYSDSDRSFVRLIIEEGHQGEFEGYDDEEEDDDYDEGFED